MAIITPGRSRSRPPYSKKTLIQDFWRGVLRVRSWPRRRGKPKQPWQLAGMERLKLAQRVVKNLPEREVVPMREGLAEFTKEHTGVKGTAAIRERDWLTMNVFGRAYMPITPDGERIYSYAQMHDVSAFLDVIEPRYGSLLVRGREGWSASRQCIPRTPLTLGPGVSTPGCCPPADIPPMEQAAGGYNDNSFATPAERVTYQDAVIESGPQIYFPFDETGGGQAEEFFSRNLYPTNDLVQGVPPLFDSSIHAISAESGNREIPTDLLPPSGDSDRSVEFTLRFDGGVVGDSGRALVAWGNNTSNGAAFEITLNGRGAHGVVGGLRISARGGYRIWDPDLNDGQVHHCHIVFSGTELSDVEAYIDGELATVSGHNNTVINTRETSLTVLGTGIFDRFQWLGEIDDLIIWDRALTPGEIEELYTLWGQG